MSDIPKRLMAPNGRVFEVVADYGEPLETKPLAGGGSSLNRKLANLYTAEGFDVTEKRDGNYYVVVDGEWITCVVIPET